MKNKLLFILLLSYAVAHAQNGPVSVITYIAKVPLVIESGLYVDTLDSEEIFQSLSGQLRVALAPRSVDLISDQYLQAGIPLPTDRIPGVEFRYFIVDHLPGEWKLLHIPPREKAVFPYDGVIVDTTLSRGDKLIIQFRFRGAEQILQQLVFGKTELLPSISLYREKNVYDSADNIVKSKSARDPKETWTGFDTLTGSVITLRAGNHAEFLFKNLHLNRDSCIEYRLYPAGSPGGGAWKRTGHLLTLTHFSSKTDYVLDTRYMGMTLSNTYRLNILPYWYETKRAQWLLGLLLVFLLLAIPYVVYRYYLRNERRKNKQLESQLLTVQSKLNPHFIYNTMSAIEGLIAENENEKASDALIAFSDLMRETFTNSGLIFISLAEEIAMLEKYLQIEQMRFEFGWVINVDQSLDPEMIEFPPMLLQPSVENAVKHGVSGMGESGMITLLFTRKDSDLLIKISDNGKGGSTQPWPGTGRGIEFTRDRIKNFQQLYHKDKIDFSVSYGNSGTVVTFHFKNWLEK